MNGTRRDFLRRAGVSTAALAVAADTPRRALAGTDDDAGGEHDPAAIVPFYGLHQAGIVTPAQDRLAFAAFDITTDSLPDVATMLGMWSAAGSLMTIGEPIGAVDVHPERPPIDTGEAFDLGPGRLTITVGFGPSFFGKLGLEDRRPAALVDLPTFRNDVIDPARSGGDIAVQACSDDPQVAFHVIRNFARIGRGTVVMRWSQLGFGRTSSTSIAQQTPRNLFGFKDGTNDIKAENTDDVERFVWIGDEADQPWMVGGSFLVVRRIRMLIETWDNTSLAEQQRVIGRFRVTGAPLTGVDEFDPVDLDAVDGAGEPVIDVDAHIRLAAPAMHGGAKMLRRGYSFTDGMDPRTGRLDAGLFFIAYVRDPESQFVAVQRALGRRDLLNEYIRHNGSGIYAVPPGLSGVGDWYGKALLA